MIFLIILFSVKSDSVTFYPLMRLHCYLSAVCMVFLNYSFLWISNKELIESWDKNNAVVLQTFSRTQSNPTDSLGSHKISSHLWRIGPSFNNG